MADKEGTAKSGDLICLFSTEDLETARKLLSLLDDKECYIMDCAGSKCIEEAEAISESKLASILAKL